VADVDLNVLLLVLLAFLAKNLDRARAIALSRIRGRARRWLLGWLEKSIHIKLGVSFHTRERADYAVN
jgi:hypothetical protein